LLWNQAHLRLLVEMLCKEKFTDGLRFVLSSQATYSIYRSMPDESKLNFLIQCLLKRQRTLEPEIRTVIKEKLAVPPYSTLSLLTMI